MGETFESLLKEVSEPINLDEVTRKALNELTVEEVSREVSYAYEHEVLLYGIDAIALTHLMQMAKDISEGRLSQSYSGYFRISPERSRFIPG